MPSAHRQLRAKLLPSMPSAFGIHDRPILINPNLRSLRCAGSEIGTDKRRSVRLSCPSSMRLRDTGRLVVTLPTVSLARSKAHSLRVLASTTGKEDADDSLGRHLNTSVTNK